MRFNKGFSLLEIVVVLIIVGLLAMIALPNFSASVERTKAQTAKSNLLAIAAGEQKYSEDNNGSYCTGAPCANTTAHINQNLLANVGISGNDPFTYSCAAASPYTCTATDGADTLTLTATSSGVSVGCVGSPGRCPA